MSAERTIFWVTAVVDGERFGILFAKRIGASGPQQHAYFWADAPEGLPPSAQLRQLCGDACHKLKLGPGELRILRELRAYAERVKQTGNPQVPMELSQQYPEDKGYPRVLSHFFTRCDPALRSFLGDLDKFTGCILRKRKGKDELVGSGATFRVRRPDQVSTDSELRYLQRAEDVLHVGSSESSWFRKTGPTAADLRSSVYRPHTLLAEITDHVFNSQISLLEGEPASGKSVLARTIALDICERGGDPVYWFTETSSPFTTSTPLSPPDPYGLAAEINSRHGLIILEDVHSNTPLYQLICSRIHLDGDRRVLLTTRPNYRLLEDDRFDSLSQWPRLAITPFAYAHPLLEHYRAHNPLPDRPWSETDIQAMLKVSRNNYWLLCYAIRGYTSLHECHTPAEWVREGVRLDLNRLKCYHVQLPQALVSLAPLSSRETWTAESFLTESLGLNGETLQELLRRGEILAADDEGVAYYRIPHASLANAYWDTGRDYRRQWKLPEYAEFLLRYAQANVHNGLTAVMKCDNDTRDAVLARLDADGATRDVVTRERNLQLVGRWALSQSSHSEWLTNETFLDTMAERLNTSTDVSHIASCLRGIFRGHLSAGTQLWLKIDRHLLASQLLAKGAMECAVELRNFADASKDAATTLLRVIGLSRIANMINRLQSFHDIKTILFYLYYVSAAELERLSQLLDATVVAELLIHEDPVWLQSNLRELAETDMSLASRVVAQLDQRRLAHYLDTLPINNAYFIGVQLVLIDASIGRAALMTHVLPRLGAAADLEDILFIRSRLCFLARADRSTTREFSRLLRASECARRLSVYQDPMNGLKWLSECYELDERWAARCAAQLDIILLGVRLSTELGLGHFCICLEYLSNVNPQVAQRICEYVCIPALVRSMTLSLDGAKWTLRSVLRLNHGVGIRLWHSLKAEYDCKALASSLSHQEQEALTNGPYRCAVSGGPCSEPSLPLKDEGRVSADVLRNLLNGEGRRGRSSTRRARISCQCCGIAHARKWTSEGFGLCSRCMNTAALLLIYSDPPVLWTTDRLQAAMRNGTAVERCGLVEHAVALHAKYVEDVNSLSRIDDYVVESLGYTDAVPLAKRIRYAALEACIAIGDEITPILLKSVRLRPWQAYFNTLYALLLVASRNRRVHELFEIAICDERRIVRKRIANILSDCDEAWARKLCPKEYDIGRNS